MWTIEPGFPFAERLPTITFETPHVWRPTKDFAAFFAIWLTAISLPCAAAPAAPSASNLYVKIQLSDSPKMSSLKPMDIVEGSLARAVYSGDREIFPLGSRVRLVVDHLERRRRIPNDHWPWVVNFFTPRRQNYPAFAQASVVSPAGGETRLQVSVISISRFAEVFAQPKKPEPRPPYAEATASSQQVESKPALPGARTGSRSAGPLMILEAATLPGSGPGVPDVGATETGVQAYSFSQPVTIPAGTRARTVLLGSVSASKSRLGDLVQARMVEPVRLNSVTVLPAGAWFEGKVTRQTPPRRFSRAGSLYLTFTELILPDGSRISATASIAGAELEQRSRTKIDPEGQLRGDRPGAKWMLINIGVTTGIAKVTDDTLQLIIEAIVSTATDVSTAGAGRIAATCASGIFLITRRGRDVVLPRFTEIDLSLDRAVVLPATAGSDTGLR
jgi:hypothetical protein